MSPELFLIFIALSIWALVWKGFALWYAARLTHKWWFIILLVVNTVGILEIIYIFLVAKRKNGASAVPTETTPINPNL